MKLQVKQLRKIMNEVVDQYDDTLKIKLVVSIDAEDLIDKLQTRTSLGVPFAAERRAKELIRRKLEAVVKDITDLVSSEITNVNGVPIAIRSIEVSKNN